MPTSHTPMQQTRKKVLIVSFFFPPNGTAGVQRVLSAANFLHDNNWEPIVLTVRPEAYVSTDASMNVPDWLDDQHLIRTRAYDVLKYLSIKGKHLGWTTAIDRWSSWIPFAIRAGKKAIKEHQPDLIWSSVPLPSAHLIASSLANYGDIPWVAEYRDPLSAHSPDVPNLKRRVFRWIDEKTLSNCSHALFVSEAAKNAYTSKFPYKPESAYTVIENGYNEQNWDKLKDHRPQSASPFNEQKFSLLYSGVLYANGRSPEPLFDALHKMKTTGKLKAENFEMVFLGAGDGADFNATINRLGISDLVHFKPPVSYLDSLHYMQQADALLLIQDAVFNMQVPLKLYEYIRSGKPILVHSPEQGSTATVARRYPLSCITQTASEIETILKDWIQALPAPIAAEQLTDFSRERKNQQLVALFDQTVSQSITK